MSLDIEAAALDWLWEETAGHPALLTDVMKAAVDRGGEVGATVLRTFEDDRFVEGLESRYFHVWWRNLRTPGQELWRRLVGRGRAIPRVDLKELAPAPASRWLAVLETTGLARSEGGEVLPRCQLFMQWAMRDGLLDPPRSQLAVSARLAAILEPDGSLEREFVDAIRRWVAISVEYAGLGLITDSKKRGNDRLAKEAHFQLGLMQALSQRGWIVEAEGWSIHGRSDVKVRTAVEGGERCCVELKIWGRQHDGVVKQVLGYALPSDRFAVVVMIDRQQGSLSERYSDFLGERRYERLAGPETQAPHFITRHPRNNGPDLRVHHCLVQLPGDR